MTRLSTRLGGVPVAAGLLYGALADADVQSSADQIRDLEHIACGGSAAVDADADTISTCPFFGCPRLPRDVLYDEKAKDSVNLLSAVASGKANRDGTLVDPVEVDDKSFPSFDEALGELSSSGSDTSATLTLIGYKGGPPDEQINQDRAFVVSPFRG